jgi:hypothetical protein
MHEKAADFGSAAAELGGGARAVFVRDLCVRLGGYQ